jgi:hypothetical protein
MKQRNLVAKNARKFNTATTFVDRKKDSKKGKRKHKQKFVADQASAFLCLFQTIYTYY